MIHWLYQCCESNGEASVNTQGYNFDVQHNLMWCVCTYSKWHVGCLVFSLMICKVHVNTLIIPSRLRLRAAPHHHHVYTHSRTVLNGKDTLKLPSLFAAWPFWTFHNKSHNMKALVILSHLWSPFLPRTCLYGTNELLWVSVQPSGVCLLRKNKTKENVTIKLLELCLFTFYSVRAKESTWHWL